MQPLLKLWSVVKKIYRGRIEDVSKTVGLHPFLKRVYGRIRPYRLVKTFNRKQLRKFADTVYSFSTKESIEISEPVFTNLNGLPDEFERVTGTYSLEQPFVAEIKHGRILEGSGIATTEDYVIILDGTSSREDKIIQRLTLEDISQLTKKQRRYTRSTPLDVDISTAVSFIPSYGYPHWAQSCLTLLQGLDVYEEQTGNRPTILLEPNPPSWLVESLIHFGYGPDEWYYWQEGDELYIGNLVVPSVRRLEKTVDYNSSRRGLQFKIGSPIAYRWVQETAISRCSNRSDDLEYSPKVFISRNDANRRRLQNRDEIMSILSNRGYKSYELASLSFEQQVKLFSQAEEVIGVHGAGLTNLIFASDCKVTELFGDYFRPTFYLLAEILDLDYHFLSGNSIPQSHPNPHHQDVELPVETLELLPYW